MGAHAERADREIREGVAAPGSAAALWRLQQRLDHARRDAHDPARVAALAERVATGQRLVGGPVFRIPGAGRAELTRRVASLNRRAERLACAPVELRVLDEDRVTACSYVVLRGEAPVLAGWRLIAIVEHHQTGTVMRAVAPEAERLDPREVEAPACDHCHLTRRRATTYVVSQPATGQRRRVGSSCLRDFLGGHDPARLCA